MRLADLLPPAIPENLAAARAGCVLDHRNSTAPADFDDAARSHGMPSWCTHKMAFVRAEIAGFNQRRVHVVARPDSMSTKTGVAPQ